MQGTLANLIWLAVAGAIGTVCRFLLQALAQRLLGGDFPWGTLGVNVLGCFLFGVIWTMAQEREIFAAATRIILLVGFMGAFTTFSTFAFETVALTRETGWISAVANVLAHNLLGLGGVVLGIALVRAW